MAMKRKKARRAPGKSRKPGKPSTRKRRPAPKKAGRKRPRTASRAKPKQASAPGPLSAKQLELEVLGEPRAPGLGDKLDPQEAQDNELVLKVIAQKNRDQIPLTRHEMTVYKRWLNRNIVRFRDAGLRAAPEALVETLLQTSRKVIQEWLGAGMPRSSDGSFDLFRILPWVKARWLGQTAAAPSSPEAAEARLRRDQAVARLKELELAEREGSLIPRAEAMQDRVAIVQTFTVILDRLAVDFRSAFATLDVGRQAEWLDVWQAGERERLVELGGVPTAGSTAEIAEAAEEARP